MDQIIAVVGEVYSMQLEVDAAIVTLLVRSAPTLAAPRGTGVQDALDLHCAACSPGWGFTPVDADQHTGPVRGHRDVEPGIRQLAG